MPSLSFFVLFVGISAVNAFLPFHVDVNFQPSVRLQAAKDSKEPAPNFKKAEFVASVAEKTGLSKTDSEAALEAVFATITEVRFQINYLYQSIFFVFEQQIDINVELNPSAHGTFL